MSKSNGSSDLFGAVAVIIGVGMLITIIAGTILHWIVVAGAIVVICWFAAALKK